MNCLKVGSVLSKSMKGGLGSSNSLTPLTAYILIALLETGIDIRVRHTAVYHFIFIKFCSCQQTNIYIFICLKSYKCKNNIKFIFPSWTSMINQANWDEALMFWEFMF